MPILPFEVSPPPPLGASTDEVLLSAENVPPEWELDAIGKGSGKPEAIVTKDIQYGPHGWRNQLNLFRPKSVDKPVPVVVYLHGGWVIGDKDGEGYQEPWVDALLANGIAVAPINYRLAPSTYLGGDPNGTLFPAQIQDCYGAVRFLRKHAAEYKLDPNNIAVMGHSAGGHLAALAGLASDVEEFHTDGWNLEVDHRVQAAVVLAGVTDLRTTERQANYFAATLNFPSWEYLQIPDGDPTSAVGCLIGGSLRDNMETAIKASPVSHVSSNDPPILLIHGFRDIQVAVHQAETLYCLLRQAGVKSELHIIPGAGHPLAKHPGTSVPIVQFLRKHFRDSSTEP